MIDRVQITKRFSLPFFPMRPRHGVGLRSVEDLDQLDPNYHWQLKLNGDRILLGVQNGRVFKANRHGAWYEYKVENEVIFAQQANQCLFDGEVYKKVFYPFEVLALPRSDTCCPRERARYAWNFCAANGIPWVYGNGLTDVIVTAKRFFGTVGMYEGVVGKRLGSAYVPLGSVSRESGTWVKRRWVGL